MTDDPQFQHRPRPEFSDRLEATLLGILADRSHPDHPTTPTTRSPKEHFVNLTLDPPISSKPAAPRRARFLLAAAAVAVLLAGVGYVLGRDARSTDPLTVATSVVDPSAHSVSFRVFWTTSDDIRDCPNTVNDPPCMHHFDSPAAATFTGDVTGTAYQSVLWNDPANYPGRDVDHLEHVIAYEVKGEVAGCGSGAFLVEETLQFVSGPALDRPSGTYKGAWTIVPGSGRGELAAISGSGTTSSSFGDLAEGRPFVGTVACPATP